MFTPLYTSDLTDAEWDLIGAVYGLCDQVSEALVVNERSSYEKVYAQACLQR
jgi:hypothetical protein